MLLPKQGRFVRLLIVGLLLNLFSNASYAAEEKGPILLTRWAKEVTAENVLPEYPRPQLQRTNWTNLNGHWDYAICPEVDDRPAGFDGKILVPFPVESVLSGVQKHVSEDERLWYRRSFQAPQHKAGDHVLLNFGAVDWEATVWVNGKRVGKHRGGFDPFTFDISDALKSGENEILISVWDPTDAGVQPRGKQISRPHGIWYTAVTGIWQTVWLEVTPASYVQSLRMTPNAAQGELKLVTNVVGNAGEVIDVTVLDGEKVITTLQTKAGETLTIKVPNAKLWSPDSPHLYGLKVKTASGDQVESYFGLRDVFIAKDDKGINRIMLNGKPLFQYGLLDQGWWPDGLYTAPTDEALRYDLEVTKQLGFNMVRKHVKVEPARWYYMCDQMGLLVWQDMPSGDKYISANDPDITRTKESGDNFEHELKAMMDCLHNCPSLVMWVPYNEGWGQWDTARISELVKKWDPSRIVNGASGWTNRGTGDVHDIHHYPGAAMPQLEENRAVVLGEFGGFGLALTGHIWQEDRNWGYRTFTDQQELVDNYRDVVTQLLFLVDKGLSAAVYTQTTDVEVEVNGLMTYDREVIKFPKEMRELNLRLYKSAPLLKALVATSEKSPQTWRYTLSKPVEEWSGKSFDDSQWKEGKAGFGGKKDPVPNAVAETKWEAKDIWLRRTVEFPAGKVMNPLLYIYHDEDAEVYINGVKIASFKGFSDAYKYSAINQKFWKHLKPGPMTIAVHCHQTRGGQYIDVGIVDMIFPKSVARQGEENAVQK